MGKCKFCGAEKPDRSKPVGMSVARFQRREAYDRELLAVCVRIAVDVLVAADGADTRLPLTCDPKGRLRLSPARVVALWPAIPLAENSGLRRPTSQKLGRLLAKAGFKAPAGRQRSEGDGRGGWLVNHDRFGDFLLADSRSWDEVVSACGRVFGVVPT